MRRMIGTMAAATASFTLAAGCMCALPTSAGAQDRAVVQVGQVAREYAEPPTPQPREVPQVAADDNRSVLRLELGPVAATTGRGLGPGLGVAADFGSGTMGFRLAAAWARGEPSTPDPSPIGGSLAQYTGELTLDFAKRGPLHPVLGIGFGYARVDTGRAEGGLGVGTARAALEYAVLFDDADIRFSAGVLGALPGPADSAVADVKGWALVGGMLGVGF
jgi:hypothetical protein